MTSIIGTANEFQLESQIQLIGSGLKEYCDQITRFAVGTEEKVALRKRKGHLIGASWSLPGTIPTIWVTAIREAGPIRVIQATGRNFLMKAMKGKKPDPACWFLPFL